MRTIRHLIMLAALTATVGCSAIYRSSSVIPGVDDGTNVRVVKLNAETVVQANSSPYTPKTLPAVFSLTAGSGANLRGAGALPEITADPKAKPAALVLTPPPAVASRPYEIGIGDVVLLSTPNSGGSIEQLSGLLAAQNSRQGYTVQDDGAVNIPNVGRVRIANLSIEDAEAELFQRLVENQFDPTFSLEISEFNSRRVSVGGAVAAPRVLPISLTPLRLSEALAAVGGVSAPDQDVAAVRIYRNGTLYQIPLATLYQRSDLLATRLEDGDAVFVDTGFELGEAERYFEQQITLLGERRQARQAALSELQTAVNLRRAELAEARSNYLSQLDLGADTNEYVYLTGEVGQQSRFALPVGRRANLADAMFDTAGGIAGATGDISQIYVLRASIDPREFGAVTAWHLDAQNAANFALSTRFELRPNDVVFVAQQPITKWNRAIDQILPTLLNVSGSVAN